MDPSGSAVHPDFDAKASKDRLMTRIEEVLRDDPDLWEEMKTEYFDKAKAWTGFRGFRRYRIINTWFRRCSFVRKTALKLLISRVLFISRQILVNGQMSLWIWSSQASDRVPSSHTRKSWFISAIVVFALCNVVHGEMTSK
jgi:hypothetical protein